MFNIVETPKNEYAGYNLAKDCGLSHDDIIRALIAKEEARNLLLLEMAKKDAMK